MHELKAKVLTASKDSNVVLSSITDTEIKPIRTFDEYRCSAVATYFLY